MGISVTQGQLPDIDLVSLGYYPILHEAHDEKLDLDEEALWHIIQLNNQRIAETGDYVPLIIGHTDDEKPEIEQPPIVGWARNFRYTTLGKENPLPAVEAEFLFPPDKIGLVKKFPRRSVELHADGLVDPIALLGASTPHLSLGLMLSKDGQKRRFVCDPQQLSAKSPSLGKSEVSKLAATTPAAETEESEMDEEKLAAFFNKCLEASPIGQYVAKKMAEESAATTPEEQKTPPAAMAEGAPPAPAAGGSTHVPELGDDEKNKASRLTKTADTRVQLERDQLAIEVVQLRKMAEDSARKIRLSERSATLKQLVYEGYQFDLASELEDVVDLDEKGWTKHLERMKKNYAKVALGRAPVSAGQTAMPTKGNDDIIKLSAKVRDYCIRNKKTTMQDFEHAMAEAQAGTLKL